MKKIKLGIIASIILGINNLQADIKLNAPLVLNGGVNAFTFQGISWSSTGSRAFYLADQDTNDVQELYSVPRGGGTVTKLNAPLQLNGDILSYVVSSNGLWVVYVADQDTDAVTELYSVSANGGVPVKLNAPLVAGGIVSSFFVSSDSSNVVYRADQDTDNVFELYSVPINGGAATKLNPALVANGDVSTFIQISTDSTRVVYTADQDTDAVLELYSVPINGGASTKLNPALVAGGIVFNFLISPDSSNVVYRADQDTDNVVELYKTPINAQMSIKLNGALVANGDVSATFQISPDSAWVVYLADQDTDIVNELYSTPINASIPLKLNSPLVANGDVLNFQIAQNSVFVIYFADGTTDAVNEIYGTLINFPLGFPLNGPLVMNGDVDSFKLSPDSQGLVYVADQHIDEVFEIYSVPFSNIQWRRLNEPLSLGQFGVPNFGSGYHFNITPDGSTVVYAMDKDPGKYQLYSAPLNGGVITRISDDLHPGGFAFQSALNVPVTTPEGAELLYISDRETPIGSGLMELYSTAIQVAGSGYDSTPIAGSSLFIGSAPVGGSITNFIDVFETKTLSLHVLPGEVGLLTGVNTSDFQIISGPIFTLTNGAPARTVSVRFAPSSKGLKTATLTFETSDRDRPTVSYALFGEGDGTSTNGPSIVPGSGTDSGDFAGDGFSDVLIYGKKQLLWLNLSNSTLVGSAVNVSLPDSKAKVLAANRTSTNNYIAYNVKSDVVVSRYPLGSFNSPAQVGSVSKKSLGGKVVASGDVNNDGILDLILLKGKTVKVSQGPSYGAGANLGAPLNGSAKLPGKIVGMYGQSGTNWTLVFQKGSSITTYEISGTTATANSKAVGGSGKFKGVIPTGAGGNGVGITKKGKTITVGNFNFTTNKFSPVAPK